jgi:hypothetical protein
MKLISIKEIQKQGFRQESPTCWKKEKKRRLRCPSCQKWNESTSVPDSLNVIKDKCFWCNVSFGIKI